MHILCTICSDLVNQAESLYVTKCGHIFHHQCLAQWIERSKSCPQCRNKVTEKCMFRMYPTVSNESSGEDAATLQSRLDDAMLQLRTQRNGAKELEDRLASATADLNKKDELLKAAEKRLAAREAAAAALREQLGYLRDQARDAQRLKDDNERITKNMQTLNGLQRVLNATADDVEQMLQGYTDIRTVATFAAALKRALCDSEGKKREWRERQLHAARQLAEQRARSDQLQADLSQAQTKMSEMERKYEALKHKRKSSAEDDRASKVPRQDGASPASAASSPKVDSFRDQRLDDAVVSEENLSFGSMVARIEQSDSPYLPLKRSGLALAALQRATSGTDQCGARSTSIFKQRAPVATATAGAGATATAGAGAGAGGARADPDASYDGLGGHGRPDVFPAPRARPPPPPLPLPRVTAKHRLKKFDPSGNQNISKMFEKLTK